MTKMNDVISSKKEKINSMCLKINGAEGDSDDEIQMSLAPFIQTYLAHSGSGGGCGCLPVPFERAAEYAWLRPSFDSDILENQFKISSFRQFTKRFRYALIYIMIVSIAWLIFLLCQPFPDTITMEYVIFSQMCIFSIWILFLTYKELYSSYDSLIATITALHLVFTSLIFTLTEGTAMMSHFTLACCVILVIYTIVPLQPYVSLIICLLFSITSEVILLTVRKQFTSFYYGFIVRILCQACVHIIGFHILVMTHVRVRGTFMKVGQRLLVRKQLEMEKHLKEQIIHSVMPPKVAGWLLSGENGEIQSFARHEDLGSLFRPFNMNRMENVSILFADIVGFTRMSSNKTAEQIVDILNDLFERFDDLCITNGCEKISTLGDCYYCVSGCPEPRSDHAKCCVEMGLDMIDGIQEFDVERGEDVNMRVGVHTGTVLCGIVGTRRFKFDVWSNDVTFANKLESTGRPGRVHISEKTAHFLQDLYVLEDYEDLQGVKTYLIKARPRKLVNKRVVEEYKKPPALRTSNTNIIPNRKSINIVSSPNKRTHYLSILEDTKSKFTSLPNVLVSNPVSLGSAEWGVSDKWLSFSRLRKNSVSETSSNSKNSNREKTEDNLNAKTPLCNNLDTEEEKNDEELDSFPPITYRTPGNRTNRRNSIQQQIYLMNGLNQGSSVAKRINSYYNSSQSTVSKVDSESEDGRGKNPSFDHMGSCFYSLRKQSDLQLIKCINDISLNNYIVDVPLDPFTLFFKEKKTEKEYRTNAHKIHEKHGDSPATFSTSRFNTYFDIFVSGLVLVFTVVSLYIVYDPAPSFIAASTCALILESAALLLCLIHLTKGANNKLSETTKIVTKKMFNIFSEWYPWHVFGGILVSLPMVVILTNFTCHSNGYDNTLYADNSSYFSFLATEENKKLALHVELRDHYYTLLVLIGLIHFCNFTQLNFFMKSILALIAGTIYIVLIERINCQHHNKSAALFVSRFLQENVFSNITERADQKFFLSKSVGDFLRSSSLEVFDAQNYYNIGIDFLNLYYNDKNVSSEFYLTNSGHKFFDSLNQSIGDLPKDEWMKRVLKNIGDEVLIGSSSETILNICIIIFLVIVLNREFEISYRLSYYCNTESSKDKMRVQNMKNQADWLLENIIPKHVSIELKNRAKYCKNHSNVGIIFASIVNFNKLYDESYSGGKEYLRVLNELISDFDELLNSERFKNVDKIKTIGSTFMGASGLNPALRKENKTEYEHIFELMDFALEMYKVVEVFNSDLLGFNLILRVGFNIGEVTAGVIGRSKLFYDIWGDAVNVASRMDSCGVDGRIQVPHSCLSILSEKYSFEPRGSVSVKGKGDILVYLVKN